MTSGAAWTMMVGTARTMGANDNAISTNPTLSARLFTSMGASFEIFGK
jgi:hypothetical protein